MMYQDDTDRKSHLAGEARRAIQDSLTLTQLYALCDEWARWYSQQVGIAIEEAQRAFKNDFNDEFRQAWAELAEAVAAFATAYDVGEAR